MSLDAAIREQVTTILGRYPEIAGAYLFGSLARGDARSDSDVDLGIVFRKRGETALDHHRTIGDLASRLEDVFPGRRLDLVVLESQGPIFGHRVLMEGERIYAADFERCVDFESDTVVRAFDHRPTHDMVSAEARRSIQCWVREKMAR
ncbi:MAG: nucleotidyltransferase domain-containing protein [Planctomycetes bacterium]|nr:nucleotidyltransferase domain-containing protein [Planctomycetota bacterium]